MTSRENGLYSTEWKKAYAKAWETALWLQAVPLCSKIVGDVVPAVVVYLSSDG